MHRIDKKTYNEITELYNSIQDKASELESILGDVVERGKDYIFERSDEWLESERAESYEAWLGLIEEVKDLVEDLNSKDLFPDRPE